MENCTDLITINGKYTNYAVDVEESIIINWSRKKHNSKKSPVIYYERRSRYRSQTRDRK